MRATVCIITSTLAAAWVTSPALAQKSSKDSEWVPPPTGSLIGGGYANRSEGSGNFKSRLSPKETPALRTAIDGLDVQAGKMVQGWSLIAPAVARQSEISVKTLEAQRVKTGMSCGELLAANSLSKASGQSFDTILGMKEKAGTWSQLARQLKVNLDSIAARARAATESVRMAEGMRRNSREQNLRDSGLAPGGSNRNPTFGGGGG